MIALPDREFSAIQEMVYAEAGIRLADTKRALVVARLSRRLRALGLDSFREYWARVQKDNDEKRAAIEALCTHETSFFREPRHFEYLSGAFAGALRAQVAEGLRLPTVRVWSAGCSSGEEPFSIAMTLLDALPGFDVQVLATDLSTRVLSQAREATWPVAKAAAIPGRLLKAFMLRGTGSEEGRMRASRDLRAVVKFAPLNLREPFHAAPGPFDAIFCRNVLIYFDQESRTGVIDRLIERLGPDGHVFVGHAETLGGFSDRLRCVMPTVYAVRR